MGFAHGSGPPFGPFHLADANNDDKVTKDELLALFGKIDSNKDGAVTHQELFARIAARWASKPAERKEPKADQPKAGGGRGMMPGFGPMRRGGPRGAADRPRRTDGKSPNSESKPAKPADADKKQTDQPSPEKKETDAPKQEQPQPPEKGAKPAADEASKQTINETSPTATPLAETKTAAREAVLAEKPGTGGAASSGPASNN